MTPPNIVFKLCKYPKNSTIATVYRFLFLEILNSLPGAILCFIDGSKIGDRTGFAYLISDQIFASRHRNSASILTVELQAIFQCLEKISLPLFRSLTHFSLPSSPYPLCQPFEMFILPTP